MTDYISRKDLLHMMQVTLDRLPQGVFNPNKIGFIAAMEGIKNFPAADVREVKRGVWRKMLQNDDGTSDYECSACAGIIVDVPDDDEHPLCNFCPNCGADMREEQT